MDSKDCSSPRLRDLGSLDGWRAVWLHLGDLKRGKGWVLTALGSQEVSGNGSLREELTPETELKARPIPSTPIGITLA